jgi:hypothetical protein
LEEIELPTMEVRQWIAGAACECGYSKDLADLLGYSAWWLENRGMKGVLRAIVYLLLIHDRPFSDLEPKLEDGRLLCLCPMLCGLTLSDRVENDEATYSDWVGGFATAEPVLMIPIIAQSLRYRFDIFLRFYDQELMFSQGGASILGESLATLHMMDARNGVDSAIRLVDSTRNPASVQIPYGRRDTLKVPKVRYLPGGGFRFDTR